MGDAETEEHQARAMRQPLVAQYDLRVPPRRVCTAACCFSLKCAGIALLASVLFVFIVMVADGMFRKVNERTPELRNGTVTEVRAYALCGLRAAHTPRRCCPQ